MNKRVFYCSDCRKVKVNWNGRRCVQCNVKARARVELDNAKMLEWSKKEFGTSETYKSLMNQQGIEVLDWQK